MKKRHREASVKTTTTFQGRSAAARQRAVLDRFVDRTEHARFMKLVRMVGRAKAEQMMTVYPR